MGFASGRTTENSPAIHRWDLGLQLSFQVPQGRKNCLAESWWQNGDVDSATHHSACSGDHSWPVSSSEMNKELEPPAESGRPQIGFLICGRSESAGNALCSGSRCASENRGGSPWTALGMEFRLQAVERSAG